MPEYVFAGQPVPLSLGCQVAKILGPSFSALGELHVVFYLEEGKRTGASSGRAVIPAAS